MMNSKTGTSLVTLLSAFALLLCPASSFASEPSSDKSSSYLLELLEPQPDKIGECEATCEIEVTLSAMDANRKRTQCLRQSDTLSKSDCRFLFRASLEDSDENFALCLSACSK